MQHPVGITVNPDRSRAEMNDIGAVLFQPLNMWAYSHVIAGAVLSGIVAGWFPWFMYMHRTIFTFYSVAFVPWVVLTLVYLLGLLIGPRTPGEERSRSLAIVWVSAFATLVVAVGAFFYPVWTAWVIPYNQWHLRMWLQSWV